MKKVKVMLASIAVLAVIGGSLAFKAKNAFGSTIFTTNTNSAPGANACSTPTANRTVATSDQGLGQVYYSISSGNCVSNSVFLSVKP